MTAWRAGLPFGRLSPGKGRVGVGRGKSGTGSKRLAVGCMKLCTVALVGSMGD